MNPEGLVSVGARLDAADLIPKRDAASGFAARLVEAFALVMALWWACQDLNPGSHPYQGSTAKRCAIQPFRWSCYSVSPT